MQQIEIYTTAQCPYCHQAKHLLTAKGYDYREIDITGDHEVLASLSQRSGIRTLPQIFFDGSAIGGYDDLLRLHRERRI